jgi:hypothetical protein
MTTRRFNVCDKARIKQYILDDDRNYPEEGQVKRRTIMPRIVGSVVVVVDYSDAHGLTYRVVVPNFNGHRGSKQDLDIVWVEPNELEQVGE